jgi:polygalacturonase
MKKTVHVDQSKAAATVCNVATFGAKPDNSTANTVAFRAATAACANKGRLGQRAVVLVPPGTWLTGSFNLSSHTELRLARGATVAAVASVDRSQFPAVAPFPSYGYCHDGGCPDAMSIAEGKPAPAWCNARTQALVSAFHSTDVVISGAGSMVEVDAGASVLDGRGCWWWAQKMRKEGSTLEVCRPQLVNFVSCIDVEVTGVTLKDPAFWNTHLWNTTGAHLHDFRIHAAQHPTCGAPGEDVRAVNSDGIDVDSSSSVLIERVYIEADDDAIAIKSGKECFGSRFGTATRNVTVRDCELVSNDFAVGSECSGGCEDIVLRDTVMSSATSDATTGCIDVLRVKSSSRPGCSGYIKNILVKNVRALVVNNSLGGEKHPDVFRFDLEGSGTPVDNLTVEDMHVDFAAGIAGQFFGSGPGNPIRGLRLHNVSIAKSSGGWVCRNVEGAEFVDVYPPPDARDGCLSKNRASMTTPVKSDDHSGVLVHFPALPFSVLDLQPPPQSQQRALKSDDDAAAATSTAADADAAVDATVANAPRPTKDDSDDASGIQRSSRWWFHTLNGSYTELGTALVRQHRDACTGVYLYIDTVTTHGCAHAGAQHCGRFVIGVDGAFSSATDEQIAARVQPYLDLGVTVHVTMDLTTSSVLDGSAHRGIAAAVAVAQRHNLTGLMIGIFPGSSLIAR